jgi:hypothetical protein
LLGVWSKHFLDFEMLSQDSSDYVSRFVQLAGRLKRFGLLEQTCHDFRIALLVLPGLR